MTSQNALVALSVSLLAGILVAACASTTEVDLATRPTGQGFGADDGGPDASGDASLEASRSGGMCPTNECPANHTTCAGSPFPCGVDLRSDNDNCGACGNACPVIQDLGVATACIDGVCRFGCSGSFGDCNGFADDGCETVLANDKNNCGGCGIKCTDICSNGKCGCPYGQTFCGEACVDVSADSENCGTCGNACPPVTEPEPPAEWNARRAACNGGRCLGLPTCMGFYNDCNGDLSESTGDGCETDTRSDAENCGACGHACQAGEACVYGQCECQCGSSCFHVTTDIDNCGACNAPCPGSRDEEAHGGPVCDDGVCDYHCNVDWGDCDGFASNGCETNLRSDPLNCGGCGVRCTGIEGQACVDGQCTVKECGIQ